MNADFISCEWEEDGLSVSFFVEDIVGDETTLRLRLGDPVEFYRAVRLSCDSWIAEMEAARREYRSGHVDDPTQQAVLDHIRDDEEDPLDVEWAKRDSGEWAREQADLIRKKNR